MKHELTLDISFNDLSAWQDFLHGKGTNTDEVVKTFTAKFGNRGEGEVEVDIKICDSRDGTPYIDAVMFQDGHEVGLLEPSEDLAGEYPFMQFLKDDYVVIIPDSIEAAKEGQKKYRAVEKWLGTLDVTALVKIEEELREQTPNVSDLIETILEKCNYEDSTLDNLYERATLKFHASGPQAFTSGDTPEV